MLLLSINVELRQLRDRFVPASRHGPEKVLQAGVRGLLPD
jgi:hypothetical protein